MKSTVAIVAGALLLGCGVGVDDPEGLAAAGVEWTQGVSALEGEGSATDPAAEAAQTEAQGTATSATTFAPLLPPGSPSTAPQDPIPVYEGFDPALNPLTGMPPVGQDCGPGPGKGR